MCEGFEGALPLGRLHDTPAEGLEEGLTATTYSMGRALGNPRPIAAMKHRITKPIFWIFFFLNKFDLIQFSSFILVKV